MNESPTENGRPERHADQLRGSIDRGHTRDKVDHPDPAAAPLGTDDEAAGAAPSPARVRQAAETEIAVDAARGGSEPAAGDAKPAAPMGMWASLAILAAAVVLAAVILTLLR